MMMKIGTKDEMVAYLLRANSNKTVCHAQTPDPELKELEGLNSQNNELNTNRCELINQ